MPGAGRQVYGAAAIGLGLVGLTWRDFTAVWQPVPAGMPGRTALAVLAGVLFALGGIALQRRRLAASGALATGALYLIFALLWLGRIVTAPTAFVSWSGCAEQLALLVAAIVVFDRHEGHGHSTDGVVRFCRVAFGLCAIAFGIAHFVYLPQTAGMVPAWLPPSRTGWAAVTGVAHGAAGVAIASGRLATLALRLLAVMFAIFGVLVWLPILIAAPAAQMSWAGNALNLALVGAALVMADALTGSRTQRAIA